ncbi:MAG: B12-binding domain-containing radical SAM protein [Gammaproteobacteria bacterium]|nr:B12-binding domain-containing radical SAM protein [Gammaproteobacteria bacterium]
MSVSSTPIVLTTLNARYIHSALGLRYLYANMGSLTPQTQIKEFTLEQRSIDIVEQLLLLNPSIIGFGIYIWNVAASVEVIQILRNVRPEIKIIIGGPEVSYEISQQPLLSWVVHLICGQADVEFPQLCQNILNQTPALEKIIYAETPQLQQLELPYDAYSQEDIAHRIIYVEASRGCPFKCQFCLSALDKTAWPFDQAKFLSAMKNLYDKGVRHFKFVDRTFNLNIKACENILDFFIQRLGDGLFLHFELIPDHLPEALKTKIQCFPEGVLQFEIGIQSLNQEVQQRIQRKQNMQKVTENLVWLLTSSKAHLHTDLIIGLPGETLQSLAQGFNQLYSLGPHEIQVGILKRLKGTPITQHDHNFEMVYSPVAPFNLLSNKDLNFEVMQRLNRFARYWDMIANSGRFKHCLKLLLQETPFEDFLKLSDALFVRTNQTHQIALRRLFVLLYELGQAEFELDLDQFKHVLQQDYQRAGLKGIPPFDSRYHEPIQQQNKNSANRRQQQHQ